MKRNWESKEKKKDGEKNENIIRKRKGERRVRRHKVVWKQGRRVRVVGGKGNEREKDGS